MQRILFIIPLFWVWGAQCIAAQEITGFWLAQEVTVGEQVLTPVAKWTKIYPDGIFKSGNGWLQNSHGTYVFEKEKQLLTTHDPRGIAENYAPFQVSFEQDRMIWQREEDGLPVRVTWVPIQELPQGPVEQLTGLWQLMEDDSPQTAFLFLRWDREIRARNKQGLRSRGYWQIHGHRSELRLIWLGNEINLDTWKVRLEDTFLYLEGISENNEGQTQVYRRSRTFP